VRLKKIEIFGFKSFADKTSLEFNAGITGVVGPNGCGKSNIADAFRWVLGEQSAKSMRGNKMPDVIFAGTTHRKPLNYAEVTITLSNEQGMLPIEFAEVAVTRRLHRSGESDYFINKHPVRLKDVQSLFLDSGMGKNAFSIFEQGKIDQVINFSPLERRYIFEEAAGILRFLQRKREALRKLEDSDQNMTRVKDIHQEVEKQIIVLQQQAEKARVFKENRSALEQLEKAVFVFKWDNFSRKNQDVRVKEESQKAIHKQAQEELVTLFKKHQESKIQLNDRELDLRKRNEQVFKTRNEKEIKSREKQSNQERLKEILAKEKRWLQELEALKQKQKERELEASSAQKQQKLIEKELSFLEKNSQKQREKVTSLEAEIAKLRAIQQKTQSDLLMFVQAENQIESELKQNTVRLENSQERKLQMGERREKLGLLMNDVSVQVREKKKLVEEISEVVDGKKEVFLALEDKLNSLNKEIQATQEELDGSLRELTEGKARQNALLRLREEMEGFSSGSKRLLQESANAKSVLYGKLKGLYEFFQVNPVGQSALAAVMRPYAQTLVVKTWQEFEEVVQFALKHKLKDFSLFCLESLKNPSTKPKINLPDGVKPLLAHLSEGSLNEHFLKHVYITDHSEAAWKFSSLAEGADIWSEEGCFIDRREVVFYTTQSENNIFLREAELKTLDKKLQQLERQKSSQEALLKHLQGQKAHVQNERVELDKSIRKEEMKLVEFNFGLQRANGDLEKLVTESKQLDHELQSVNMAIDKLTSLITELRQRHAEAKSKGTDIQQKASGLQLNLDQLVETAKFEQRELQDREAALQKVADENRKLSHALNVLEVKELEGRQQQARLEEEIEAGKELQDLIHNRSSEFDQGLLEVEKVLGEVVINFSKIEQEVQDRKKAIEKEEETIRGIQDRLKQIETDLYQTGIQRTQTESSKQAIENELQERYRLTIEEARALIGVADKSLEQMERQIRALRQEMDAAGDINMTSIEEFDKHKSRYEFLNQQLDDLRISKQELIEIITQLDTESRKIFKETFDLIRANFKKNFKILFNGGEADLEFTETGDVLEAGIEIIAKPPGKQMRSISLLSGGEKCLTAMALLFAIFEVKPAPFCILDEIDAPLDDTNVERFVNVVQQFINRCQFIIITHNKRTMAIADVLFGVSMEERGVSKLLSIQFNHNVEPVVAYTEHDSK